MDEHNRHEDHVSTLHYYIIFRHVQYLGLFLKCNILMFNERFVSVYALSVNTVSRLARL